MNRRVEEVDASVLYPVPIEHSNISSPIPIEITNIHPPNAVKALRGQCVYTKGVSLCWRHVLQLVPPRLVANDTKTHICLHCFNAKMPNQRGFRKIGLSKKGSYFSTNVRKHLDTQHAGKTLKRILMLNF